MSRRHFGPAMIGVAILSLGACGQDDKDGSVLGPADATIFLADRPCIPPTPDQARRTELALAVLRDFSRHASIYRGAMDVLGRTRDAENFFPGEHFCVSEDDLAETARLTVEAGAWRGLVGMSHLTLAFRLGPRDPAIVDAVAATAFVDRPIEDGPYSDIRPRARAVLASFGTSAAPWRDQAMAGIAEKGSLGTSAAQVAAASGDPAAVAEVARRLQVAIDAEPSNKAIGVKAGERIRELAFALGAAREQARPRVPMLVALLNRDFTIGSHFGALELAPTSLCRVLRAIGGPEADAATRGPRCRGDWYRAP